MKRLLILLVSVSLLSCSEDCEYGGDQERVQEIQSEIDELEEKRDEAPTEVIAETYQKQIDRKTKELGEEISSCD